VTKRQQDERSGRRLSWPPLRCSTVAPAGPIDTEARRAALARWRGQDEDKVAVKNLAHDRKTAKI